MKRTFVLVMILLAAVASAQAKKVSSVKYDIESAGPSKVGTYLVQVWVFSKNGKVSEDMLKYAAVHGVIFRGFTGETNERPIASSPLIEQEKKDFFDDFFSEEGAFRTYATIVPGQLRKIKTSTGEFKVGAVLSVQKDRLKQFLVEANIVKGLKSGF